MEVVGKGTRTEEDGTRIEENRTRKARTGGIGGVGTEREEREEGGVRREGKSPIPISYVNMVGFLFLSFPREAILLI